MVKVNVAAAGQDELGRAGTGEWYGLRAMRPDLLMMICNVRLELPNISCDRDRSRRALSQGN